MDGKTAAIWESRWVRFRMALKQAGIDARMQDYCRGWVLGFLGFLKPRKFSQAEEADVRGYLLKLANGGKVMWQVIQAQEALRIFFSEVEPVSWAKAWPEDLAPKSLKERLPLTIAAEISKPPTVRAGWDFHGRTDTGECPEKYRNFIDLVQEALRTERYAYRTEQTYLEWVRRFLIFSAPASRHTLEWWQVKDYLDFLTLVRRVSNGTQNQALSALQFLFAKVLRRRPGNGDGVHRAAGIRRVPTVLTRDEVGQLLDLMEAA